MKSHYCEAEGIVVEYEGECNWCGEKEMNNKERAVMQQALEALENERSHMTANWDNIVKAITALREALAEPDMNLNCKSVQARLATLWGYVKAEQAEQEPVGEMIDKAGYKGAAWYLEPPTTGTPLYAAPVSIEAAVLAEREACAKVCDEIFSKCVDDFEAGAADSCAAAIRARGEK